MAAKSYDFFRVSRPQPWVAHVEIHRPQKMNAFTEVLVRLYSSCNSTPQGSLFSTLTEDSYLIECGSHSEPCLTIYQRILWFEPSFSPAPGKKHLRLVWTLQVLQSQGHFSTLIQRTSAMAPGLQPSFEDSRSGSKTVSLPLNAAKSVSSSSLSNRSTLP